jgi:hypothetical protein
MTRRLHCRVIGEQNTVPAPEPGNRDEAERI